MNEISPAMRALNELISSGQWRNLPGPPNAVIFMHPWEDGTVDTLAMHSEIDSLAERTNQDGKPVWRATGSVIDVIAKLRNVPSPLALDAPRQVLPDNTPNADRDMGLT
ncbi:MAG TPA: hypothetical protein VHX38_26865 [Pseudonocardiaceae bacterium]|jgi:hypothetical protein|nr:hypothetical protein [Pseudonocardiaceae bacterium]